MCQTKAARVFFAQRGFQLEVCVEALGVPALGLTCSETGLGGQGFDSGLVADQALAMSPT